MVNLLCLLTAYNVTEQKTYLPTTKTFREIFQNRQNNKLSLKTFLSLSFYTSRQVNKLISK